MRRVPVRIRHDSGRRRPVSARADASASASGRSLSQARGAGRPGRLVSRRPGRLVEEPPRRRRRGERARGHVQRVQGHDFLGARRKRARRRARRFRRFRDGRRRVSFAVVLGSVRAARRRLEGGRLRASALEQTRRRRRRHRFSHPRGFVAQREMRHGSRGRRRRGGARPRPRARQRRLRRSARAGSHRLTRRVPPAVRSGNAPERRARRRRGVFARGPTAEGGGPRIRAVLPRRRRGCRGGPREPRREDMHSIPLRAPTRPLRRHARRPERRASRDCARDERATQFNF